MRCWRGGRGRGLGVKEGGATRSSEVKNRVSLCAGFPTGGRLEEGLRLTEGGAWVMRGVRINAADGFSLAIAFAGSDTCTTAACTTKEALP